MVRYRPGINADLSIIMHAIPLSASRNRHGDSKGCELGSLYAPFRIIWGRRVRSADFFGSRMALLSWHLQNPGVLFLPCGGLVVGTLQDVYQNLQPFGYWTRVWDAKHKAAFSYPRLQT